MYIYVQAKDGTPLMPTSRDGKILFDPDHTFGVTHTTTHCEFSADVLAVGFKDGKLRFDLSEQCSLERDVPYGDCCYGVYVEFWPWALKVLLENIRNPYVPEDDYIYGDEEERKYEEEDE